MESIFKVRVTPRKMGEVFEDYEHFNIRQYSFLGIEEEKDFDAENCSEKEWESLRDVPCLYFVRLRHEEFLTHLQNRVYASWGAVEKAISKKKKELGDKIYSEFKKTCEMRWRRNGIEGHDKYYCLVEVREGPDACYAVKGAVDLSDPTVDYAKIIDFVTSHGYKTIKELTDSCSGDEAEAYGIIAEWFFEQYTDDLWRCSPPFASKEGAIEYVETNMLRSMYCYSKILVGK